MSCEFGINLAMLYKGNLIVNQLWEIRSGLGVVEGNPIREDGTIDYCQLHHVKVVTFVVCHPILFCVFFWPSFVAESSGRFNFGLYILLRRQKLDFDLMTKESQFFLCSQLEERLQKFKLVLHANHTFILSRLCHGEDLSLNKGYQTLVDM